MNNLILFALVLISSYCLTYFMMKLAISRSILDLPNDRSSHSVPVPRIGGVAIVLVWFSSLVYFYLNHIIENKIFFALLAGIPLTLTGFLDDIIHLKPSMRFLVQALCGAVALFFVGGLQIISFFTYPFTSFYILNIIALVAIIWSINLFNFLDGIDGYISMEAIYTGIAIFALTGDHLGLLLVFSTLGFLIWNWQPAKIFMGDAGSTLLGFSIAVLIIYYQNTNMISIPVWLIITSVFWFDATVTLFRRIRNREHLSQAHRKHAYQRIVQSGFSHSKTVLWSMGLNVLLFGLAWLAVRYEYFDWIILTVTVIFLTIVNKYIDSRKAFVYDGNITLRRTGTEPQTGKPAIAVLRK
jgi:UDP-N-acetylmuramyl pentapeptide phosphotransferase/UDP-N-acetylglucosamine-1-phosphate transferase